MSVVFPLSRRLVFGVACLAHALSLPAFAAPPEFRSFSSLDGMPESWISDVTLAPSGRLLLTHGEVKHSSLFDGYRFSTFPSPGRLLTIRESPSGERWALLPARNGLQLLTGNSWTAFQPAGLQLPHDPDATSAGGFLPWAPGAVLLPEPNRLLEFRLSSRSIVPVLPQLTALTGPLSAFAPDLSGRGAWVGGSRALAHLRRAPDGSISFETIPLPPGSGPALRLLECEDGTLFLTAQPAPLLERLYRYSPASSWSRLLDSAPRHHLSAWSGADQSLWVADTFGDSFDLLHGSSAPALQPVPRERVLSGRLQSVLYLGRGSFLLATSLGLAHHAPSVWRTPQALSALTRHSSAILSARSGDLYLIHGNTLLRRHLNAWSVHPLPPSFDPLLQRPFSLAELPDGRLALGAGPGLLLFLPASSSFQVIPHPQRLSVSVTGSARDGSLFVATTADNRHHRLELFDGQSFSLLLDQDSPWRDIVPRQTLELSDGRLALIPDQQGFGLFDRKSRRYTRQSAPPASSGSPFTALEIGPGHLWLGARDQLFSWHDGQWTTLRHRLQSIRSLFRASDGSIWIASGRGLTRFHDGSWIAATAAEGLPDGAAYGIAEDTAHQLWVTTSLGIAASHWDADRDAPATFLPLAGNPSSVAPNSPAHIVFSGIDRWKYSHSDRLLFSWRLDRGPWSPFQPNDSADLTGLAQGGSHLFEVRATDRNGNIDPHPASLDFKVLLPWYREPGFLAVGLLGLLSLGIAIALFLSRHRHLATLVTERTAQLNESTLLLRQIADTAPGVLYTYQSTPGGGRFPYISPRVAEFCGVDAADVIRNAQVFLQLIHPQDLIRIRESFAQSALTSTPWHDEFRLRRPDGSEIWLEGHSSSSPGAGGALLWFGIFTDITSRKLNEEARRQSETRYRDLFNHMSEGFVFARMIFEDGEPVDYTYLAVNQNFYSLTGFPPVEGRRVSEIFPQLRANDPEILQRYGRVASTGRPDKFEIYVKTIDRWYSISAYCPLPGHFVSIFEVITERKRTEAERERLQAQVIQAQKMESVGRLAGGIAHDFNNLLTLINGYASIALNALPPASTTHDAVSEIARAGDRAAALVRQLLVFSRKTQSNPQVVELNSIVSGLRSTLLPLVGETVRIESHLAPGPFPLLADPHQLEQVLMNLVVNARDAMPHGGSISISTMPLSPSLARLSVRDTGSGIPEEIRPHLFEPFFTTKPEGHGTGLGLSVVHGIVTRAGGSITVDSTVGQGSTFHIDLPLTESSTTHAAAPQTTAARGSGTILVVEDQPEVRLFVTTALSSLGYSFLAAGSAAEALPLLATHSIDLLLTDIVMPGASGLELAAQSRQLYPHLPILFMSGYSGAQSAEVDEAAANGEFLQKPFTPAQLADRVQKLIRRPTPSRRILVVDDESSIRHLLQLLLAQAGYSVSVARDGLDALAHIDSAPPQFVLTDLAMPGLNGEDLILRVRKQYPSVTVVAMSGTNPSPTPSSPLGPHAAIAKPIDSDELLRLLDRLANHS